MNTEGRVATTDEYINRLILALKRIKDCSGGNGKSTYNNTEMRLIGEIVAANVQGGHVISTELAKALGVTRSAISQMVNRMEEKGIIVRVPAQNDRKKVYIELTERTKECYEREKGNVCREIDKIVELMGKEDMEKLLALADKFIACQEKLKKGESKPIKNAEIS